MSDNDLLKVSCRVLQKNISSENRFSFSPIIRIGFVGFGVVGQGVWKHLKSDMTRLEKCLGVKIHLAKVAVTDLNKKRDVAIREDLLTDDPMAVAQDPDIDIVCELMGGVEKAKKVIFAALDSGKIVITANKAFICDHGETLFKMIGEKKKISFLKRVSLVGFLSLKRFVRDLSPIAFL